MPRVRDKANNALYEARAGRKIVEGKADAANKKANDALYEARVGRTKLEQKISQLQTEIGKISQGVGSAFQAKFDARINNIQKNYRADKI